MRSAGSVAVNYPIHQWNQLSEDLSQGILPLRVRLIDAVIADPPTDHEGYSRALHR
jgi:hypothetical protein